jgi:O-antigen/teichoic acid export membrane protein
MLIVAGLILRHFLISKLFDGSTSVFIALLVAVTALWGSYLTRGAFAGRDQYGVYGLQLALEGAIRAVAAATAVWFTWSTAGFSLSLAAALAISVIFTLPWLRGGKRNPATTLNPNDRSTRDQLSILAWLVFGAAMMQTLTNIGPIVAKLTPNQTPGAAGNYLAGIMLARLPLFVFAAIQAALLPRLARSYSAGDNRGFRRQITNLSVLIVLAMGVFVAVLVAAGPTIVEAVYGGHLGLGRSDLAIMAAATAMIMLTIVAGSGAIAVGAAAASSVSWAVGVAGMAAVLVLWTGPLFTRLEISYLAGATTALLGQVVVLRRRLVPSPWMTT